jgi:hypothetical protein
MMSLGRLRSMLEGYFEEFLGIGLEHAVDN